MKREHYYGPAGIQAIDAIEAWGLGFALGNAVKYLARAGKKTKDRRRDLEKAMWYIQWELKKESPK